MPNSPSMAQLATSHVLCDAPLFYSASLLQSLVTARFRVRLGARVTFLGRGRKRGKTLEPNNRTEGKV